MMIGAKWTVKEELELLNEIKKNKTVKQIAENHERTVGGINSRIRHIAYNMHKNSVPMNEIENKTKLSRTEIECLIGRTINVNSVKKNKNREIYEKLIEMDKKIVEIKKII